MNKSADIWQHLDFIEECMRTARRLRQMIPDSAACSIFVTSPGRGDGRTSVAVGLALSFRLLLASSVQSEMQSPVLLLELSAPSPSLSQRLGIQHGCKFPEVMKKKRIPYEELLHPKLNVSVLPLESAPADSFSLYENKALHYFLDELRNHFPVIIIDGPPMDGSALSTFINEAATHTLLVLRAGKNQANDLRAAHSRCLFRPPCGILVNGIRPSWSPFPS